MTKPDPRSKAIPAPWQQPLDQWTRWLRASNRSRETIRTRTDHLRRLARAIPAAPNMVTGEQLVDWASAQTWKTETRRSVYASIRGFFSWAEATGWVAESPASVLPAITPAPPQPRPCPAPVLDAARANASPRVLLMLRLGAEAGMRRAEISVVHERDLVADLLGWTLIVHGKGDKVRVVPITDDLAEAIRFACRAGGGYAFPGRLDGHLSAQTVGKLMAAALEGTWTAHTLRHRFGTVTHAKSGDLIAVSRLLGHASVATTQRYVATEAKRLREVASAAA